MNIFDKVFGNKKPNTIEISYGKARYDIDFTEGSIEDGTITVGELRSQCTYITETPGQNIRLLYRGKNLTNDTVKLIDVGMKSGSKVLCMASKSTAPPEQSAQPVTTSGTAAQHGNLAPKTPKEQIDDLLKDIKANLEPSVRAYITKVPSQDKEKKETHDRLAELLLQKLFAIDGITARDDAAQSDREDLRRQRKEAVQYTQGLLDSVDAIVRQDQLESDMSQLKS